MPDLPPNLVTPTEEGAPQPQTRRVPWGEAKVQTEPRRRDRREFQRALDHQATP